MNSLEFVEGFNIQTYENFYNGGGVAIGDVTGNGLPDIFLTANMGTNRLYENLGDYRFRDITGHAGVAGTRAWSTGVSMADINGDGYLDIYVCNSGIAEGDDRRNELFINNGDGNFTEMAAEYGLDDDGFSIHAVFFDYNRDGRLDAYIVNNSHIHRSDFSTEELQRTTPNHLGGDRLYRNDGNTFSDVTEEAGIYRSVLGRGLGAVVSDFNRNGWMDLYISNDFEERDYLYLNNGDGTFREAADELIQSMSLAAMGGDAGDLTGNGYPDLFITEMLHSSDVRNKTNTNFIDWETYNTHYVDRGYHHQYIRNTLQLNHGIIPGRGASFSEAGRQAVVEATDWSWGANILDLNSDGQQEIFVAIGIFHDILDKDYLKYTSTPRSEFFRTENGRRVPDVEGLIEGYPSTPVPNAAFVWSDSLDRYV
ncbi:MAG: VCBS repeat-containing protein, partial [Balneolaceae bacterium]